MQDQPEHVDALDVLKALGCAGIFLGHFIWHARRADPGSILDLLVWPGNLGITVFAFASGYGLALSRRDERPRMWWKRRLLRLLPPLWVFYGFVLAGHSYAPGGENLKPEFLLNLLGLNGLLLFGGQHAGIAGHTWFVTFILLCYLCFPLISDLAEPPATTADRRIAILVVVYVFSLMFYKFVQTGGVAFFPCVPSFWFGVFAAKRPFPSNLSRRVVLGLGVALVVIITANTLYVLPADAAVPRPLHWLGRLHPALYPFYPVVVFPLTVALLRGSFPEVFGRVMRVVSAHSFEVYLYHPYTMGTGFLALWLSGYGALPRLIFAVVMTAILCAAARRIARPVRGFAERCARGLVGA